MTATNELEEIMDRMWEAEQEAHRNKEIEATGIGKITYEGGKVVFTPIQQKDFYMTPTEQALRACVVAMKEAILQMNLVVSARVVKKCGYDQHEYLIFSHDWNDIEQPLDEAITLAERVLEGK